MRRSRSLLLVAAAVSAASSSLAAEIQITALDPPAAAVLPEHAPVYARIQYRADQPLRFQAIGYLRGEKVPGRTNASPAYAAGAGEAIAWTSLEDGKAIDELRVVASDARWQPLAEVSVKVDVRWSGSAPPREVATWAAALEAEQQRRVSADMQAMSDRMSSGPFAAVGTLLVMSIFPGYLVAQVVALLKLRGGWRWAGAGPLLFMVPCVLFSLFALAQGSNLWPIWLIFLAPVGLVYLAALFAFRWMAGKSSWS
jgi:hypothetical protein